MNPGRRRIRLYAQLGQAGPDPEPLAGNRLKRVLERVEDEFANGAGQPLACPLDRALGRESRCAGRVCAYYRVPGVAGDCAVARWTGPGGPNRRLADWLNARRFEPARRAVAPPSSADRQTKQRQEES